MQEDITLLKVTQYLPGGDYHPDGQEWRRRNRIAKSGKDDDDFSFTRFTAHWVLNYVLFMFMFSFFLI